MGIKLETGEEVTIGRIERLPIRELWAHEEHDFTVWLEENLEVLSDAVGIRLQALEREKRVGSFRVDLVAETLAGDMVIIENQLEPSNHDHLGKVVTYFSNLQAALAVWIVTTPRPEHVTAVNWLNESTPVDKAFFLVSLEGIRIGSSPPAPLLTLITGPSEDLKAIGQEKKDLAERHLIRLRYWEELLERAERMGVRHHENRAPGKEHWLSAGAGRGGISWTYLVYMQGRAGVELYIDTGDKEENERIFRELLRSKSEVEQDFLGDLDWQLLEDKRACRVRAEFECGGLREREEWPAMQEQSIRLMASLVKTLGPLLRRAA